MRQKQREKEGETKKRGRLLYFMDEILGNDLHIDFFLTKMRDSEICLSAEIMRIGKYEMRDDENCKSLSNLFFVRRRITRKKPVLYSRDGP